MANKISNRSSQEHMVVALGTAAMAKSGDIQTTGNTVDLAEGVLGFISDDAFSAARAPGAFLQGGETPATVGKIRAVVGTGRSSNISAYKGWKGLEIPAYETSPQIKSGDLVSVSALLPAYGTHSTQLYRALKAPTVGRTYEVYPILSSEDIDRDHDSNEWSLHESFTVPSDASGTLTDYVICNLVYKLNLQSNYVSEVAGNLESVGKAPMLALALDADGGGSGTAIGALQVGDTVPFMTINGSTINLTMTADLLNTMNAWISSSNITASTEIVNVNLTTAGSLAADMFVLIGLDYETAPISGIKQKKVRVTAELGGDWSRATDTDAYATEELAPAYDDQVSARALEIWRNHTKLHYHQEVTGHKDDYIDAPNYLDTTKRYAIRRLDFASEGSAGSKRQNHNNWSLIILGQTTDDAATTDVATGITVSAANAQHVTDLNAILGVWLKADPTIGTVKYLGSSTASTLFV